MQRLPLVADEESPADRPHPDALLVLTGGALDSTQHREMLPAQPGSILLDRACTRCTNNDVCHFERWRILSLVQFARALHVVGTGQFEFVERRARGFQMPRGEMKVKWRWL